MEITYKLGVIPHTEEIIELYKSAGLNRPVNDKIRITKMYAYSNLVVTARHNDKLVGIARSLTDFCYCCYMSDLAVMENYKKLGIGQKLIRHTQDELGEQVTLLLLSAPGAMEYYPKIGFETVKNGFIIYRKA